MPPASPDRWAHLTCKCGHLALVKLPGGPWQHRDQLMRRARCKVCGQLGAVDFKRALPPDGRQGGWGFTARPDDPRQC